MTITKDVVIQVIMDRLYTDPPAKPITEQTLLGDGSPPADWHGNYEFAIGCESLDIVELAMDLSTEFDIAIPDDVVEGFTTVGDIIAYIEKSLKELESEEEV